MREKLKQKEELSTHCGKGNVMTTYPRNITPQKLRNITPKSYVIKPRVITYNINL